MVQPNWATFFGISENELAKWKSEMKYGDEILSWALRHGKLDEKAYLEWALETYLLPVVQESFFQIPADLSFWDSVSRDANWTRNFFPLAHWQGTLLIGCIEPPERFTSLIPHRFVLASTRNLDHLWLKFNPLKVEDLDESANEKEFVSSPSEQVAIMAPNAAPVALVPSIVPPTSNFDLPDSMIHKPEGRDPLMAVDLSIPDGLLKENHVAAPVQPPPQAEMDENVTFDAPDGLFGGTPLPSNALHDQSSSKTFVGDFNGDFSKFNNASSVSETEFQEPIVENNQVELSLEPLPAEPAPQTEQKTHEANVNQSQKSSPVAPAYRPPPASAKPVTVQVQISAPAITIITGGEDRADSAPISGDISSSSFNATEIVSQSTKATLLADAQNFDALGVAAIGHILETFEHGMILLFRDGQLRPWKWSELLLSVHGTNVQAIPLETASIFKVVYRTCLPYHGYVVPTAVNKQFWHDFTRGAPPKHVSLLPIIIKKQLAGMVMGLTNNDLNYRASLAKMHQLATELSRQLEHLKEKSAA